MWLRFRSSPQNLVEGRDSAVIKEKASGAGEVAIRRMRNPRTGCYRRLRSRKSPARKSGGAFLPTARQTGPSHRDRRRSLDSGAPRTGSLAQRKACLFPTDLRLQYQLRPKAEHRHRRGPPQRMARCQRHAATPWTGRQVFNENDLAFPLDDRGEYGKAARTQTIDAGQPALGRTTAARERTPLRFIPARQGQAGRRGPTLSRTAGKVDPSWRSRQPRRGGRRAEFCE